MGVNPDDGMAALLDAIGSCPRRRAPRCSRRSRTPTWPGPPLAMVDSARGITNLHVPSDVIIDASMPAAIRSSGQMWNPAGELQDANFVIPDHSYAALYAETVEDCRRHGAFDPATMGSTSNVGLMAQAAEEYGSHDTTFQIQSPGVVRVIDDAGATLLEHDVGGGRHLAHVHDPRCRGPRLGRPRSLARTRDRAPPSSGWTRPGRTTRNCCARCARRSRCSIRRGSRSSSWTSRARRATRWRGRARTRTRSPSPATCCVTTSPTSSRSSSSARARRCSRSCA